MQLRKVFIFILFIISRTILTDSIIEKNKPSLIIYGGKYTTTDLLPIMFRQKRITENQR